MANLSNINGKFVVEQTTGYVGVGTTDPNYSIEVLNASAEIALNASGGSIYRVQSDSASNFIIRKEGVGDRLVINSAGNSTFSGSVTAVGISSTTQTTTSGYFATSTTIPGNQIVHVRDNVATTLVSSAGGIKISSSPGNDVFLLKRWDHSASSSYFALQNSSAAEFITVNMASGNVGIGTTTPGNSILSIHFDDSYGAYGPGKGVNVTNETTTGAAGFVQLSARYNNTSPAQTFYQVGGMGGGKETALGNNEWGGYLSFWTTSDGTAGAASGMFEHMRITADGNVGIGTIAPGQKLAIEGGGTANESILRVNNQANVSSRIWLRNSAQSAYIFNSGSTPDTLATNILAQAFGLGINNNSSIQFYNGLTASVKMTILPSGNVGIGRTQADNKLEVEGNIKAKDVDGKIFSMAASWAYVASKNDLFSYPGTDGAVWEYTIKMNPNSAGSGLYRDFYYGKLGIGIGWNGSNVTQYIWQQQDQTAPRTLYNSGGGNYNPLFRMYYSGGVYTELAHGTAWTLRIQGLSTSTYGDIFFRRLA